MNENITREAQDDFTVEMLKEISDSANHVATVLHLVDMTVAKCKKAIKVRGSGDPEEHTKQLMAWDAMIDLHVHREMLGLDDPAKRVPIQYYFTDTQQRKVLWRLNATSTVADCLHTTWKGSNDLVMPLMAACVDLGGQEPPA